MKYSLKATELISFFLACALGIIFHFIYQWSDENPVAGLFFPVNESTWEHLKLIFFPILITSVIEYFILKESSENLICIKFLSVLLGMVATVVLFYTYTGVYGKNSDVMNILIYLFSMGVAFGFSYRSLRRHSFSHSSSVCYLGFALLTLLFALFTLFPPRIGLFTPPFQISANKSSIYTCKHDGTCRSCATKISPTPEAWGRCNIIKHMLHQ